jgi:hypothetical protein
MLPILKAEAPGYSTPVIAWLEGRDDVFLHELAHHYGVISDDHRGGL